MYIILHETTIKSALNILKVKKLLKSSKTRELGISTGQGRRRKLTKDPYISLYDTNFYEKYDEVDGVYFRLLPISTPVRPQYGGECVLVFSKDLLNHKKFILNTEENFGFCIAKDGITKETQFSGEEGMTITKIKNLNMLKDYHFNPYSSELVILDNIDLKYLKCIFVRPHLINNDLIEQCHHKNIQLYSIEVC